VVGQATGDQDDVAVGVQGDVAQRPALADVDLELDVLLVLGKGRRERTLPFGRRAGEALDRYLRARARHNQAALPWLWLGRKGRLTEWGLVMMLRRRGAQAACRGCTRTSSGTPSPTSGSPKAGERPT
jgi:integrase